MEIFKLFGSILVDSAQAENSIQKTGDAADGITGKLGKGIATAAKWGAAIAAGAVAAGGAVVAFTNKIADNLGAIDDAAQRAGMTAEKYQEYAYAAKQSGVETATLERTMTRAQKSFADAKDGSASMAEAYERLGINIDEVGSSSEAFDLVIMRLSSMTDETERNALANDIFGKSYADLNPLFNQGAAGMDALKKEARDLGAVLSNDAVTSGADFGDMLLRVQTLFGNLGNSIAVYLMPILHDAMGWVVEHGPEIQEVAGAVIDFIVSGIQILVDWIASVIAAGKEWAANNQETLQRIQTMFQQAFDFIGKLLAVFADIFAGDWDNLFSETLPDLLESAFELIDSLLGLAMDALVAIVKGIGSALYNAGKAIFTSMWDGIKSVWTSIKNWVQDKVDWLVDKLAFWRKSSAEMDDDSPSTSRSPDGFHAAGLPFVPYDGYRAELHRGESVLSADSTKQMIEAIVNGIATAQPQSNQTQPIVIQVTLDKKVLAQAMVDPMAAVIKQRGDSIG